MKKSLAAKIFSVMLAAVLLCTPLLSLTASAAKKSQNYWPLINVHGFFSCDIHADKEDKNSEVICPWATNDILSCVADCVPALAEFAITKDYDKFGDSILPRVRELFEPSFCDPDGTVSNGSGVYFEYPKPGNINKYSQLSFRYDWRLDPFEIAAQLNDFIDYVLECSGCDKVALSCHSLGGVIALTYLTVYGNEKIQGIAFNTTAIYGEAYTGQLFSGEIKITKDALVNFLAYVLDENDFEILLNGIIDILAKAGLVDAIANLGNDIVDNLLDKTIPEVLMPLFCRWLTLWAMCPDDYIDAAYSYMFSRSEPSVNYTELQKKIQQYNTVVRANREKTLKAFDEVGRVVVVSRYGYSSIPLTDKWYNISDGVVDSAYSSFGATTAPFGTKFDDEYLAKVDPEFISPDKTVDASTCLFPEKTWFIKDYPHATTHDPLDDMMYTLLFNPKEEATVDTYDQYPRFLKYIKATDAVVPDDNVVIKSNIFSEIFKNILRFFEKIVNFLFYR